MGVQRYVANDLTHFVGRGMKEEKQYELMLKIIREGWLTHPPHDPNKQMKLSYGPEALLSADGYAVRCVCFCDIPLADLNLHMAKYSRFGLAFSKRTMAKKGASPVFYVANDSRHLIGRPPYVDGFGTRIEEGVRRGWVDRGLVFDMFGRGVANALMAIGDLAKSSRRNEDARMTEEEYNIKFINDLIKNLGINEDQICQLSGMFRKNQAFSKLLSEVVSFVYPTLFGFLKGFDSTLAEHDPCNYYMEREWRVMGHVQFVLEEIERVIFPRAYAERFRADNPSYLGQIHFADDA